MSCEQLKDYHPSQHYHHPTDSHLYPQSFTHHHHLHHMHRQVTESLPSSPLSPPTQHKQSLPFERKCSICEPNLVDFEPVPLWLCVRHSSTPLIVPAPPGWSAHESTYSSEELKNLQQLLKPDMKNQKAKAISVTGSGSGTSSDSNTHRPSPKFMIRQRTVGSGENYGFIYGPEDSEQQNEASNNSEGISERSFKALRPVKCPQINSINSRFKTEAVIEVDQKRPFSFESTKSAPDVIATH